MLDRLKRLISVKGLLALIFLITLYKFINYEGMEKYIIAAVLCAVYFFLGRKKKWSAEVFLCVAAPVLSYLLIGGISGIFNGSSYMTSIKVFIYWLVPLMVSFALYVYYGKDMDYIIDIQLLSSCVVYGYSVAYILYMGYVWESTFAFAFGAFAIYYAYKKRWVFLAISLQFLYWADKRIAMLGVILALLVLVFMWFFKQSKKLVILIWSVVITGIYAYMYLIYSGAMEYYCWGFDINTNGRAEMYSKVANHFDFSLFYPGAGIGVVENLLNNMNVQAFANLHNDLLKFYIELGFVGLFVFLVSYIIMFHLAEKLCGKSQMCFMFAMSLYSIVLYATDNVSIYVLYLLPLYSTFFAVLAEKNHAVENKESI